MDYAEILGLKFAYSTNGHAVARASVQNTMKYIHTLEFKDEDFEIATATTEEEIKQLGLTGFVKYDEMHGIHFYKRPKRFSGLK